MGSVLSNEGPFASCIFVIKLNWLPTYPDVLKVRCGPKRTMYAATLKKDTYVDQELLMFFSTQAMDSARPCGSVVLGDRPSASICKSTLFSLGSWMEWKCSKVGVSKQ